MCATVQVDVCRDSLAWKEGKKNVCVLATTVAKNTLPTSSAQMPFLMIEFAVLPRVFRVLFFFFFPFHLLPQELCSVTTMKPYCTHRYHRFSLTKLLFILYFTNYHLRSWHSDCNIYLVLVYNSAQQNANVHALPPTAVMQLKRVGALRQKVDDIILLVKRASCYYPMKQ